jgi:predicted TPR repeat methyltransferase
VANDFIGAQLISAGQHIERGELKAAATLLNALVKSAPRDPRLHFVAASMAQKAGNLVGCVKLLERALDAAPDWVEAHVARIRAASQMNEHQFALDASVEALSLCGEHLDLLEIASAVADRAEAFEKQEGFLQRAVALAPLRVDILNALAVCAQRLDHLDIAEQSFQRARDLAPGNVVSISGLAAIRSMRGDIDAALRDLALANRLAPDDPVIAFNLAAATGEVPKTMPAAMVTALFDDYASRFDAELVGDLRYGVPRRFSEIIIERHPNRVFDVLDLGSGTGLVGLYLSPFQGALVGVELSGKMIAEAAKHGLYHRIHQVNVLDALEHTPADQYDVITAADVFIYVGDLTNVIPNAFKILHPGGVLLFSCERAVDGEPDLILRPTNRFAHSESSVKRLCAAAGFGMINIEAATLRNEGGEPLDGFICRAERV